MITFNQNLKKEKKKTFIELQFNFPVLTNQQF